MHAHFDLTNLFLRMASVDILTHVQNICNIIHNTVGNSLPLICPSLIVHLYDSIFNSA